MNETFGVVTSPAEARRRGRFLRRQKGLNELVELQVRFGESKKGPRFIGLQTRGPLEKIDGLVG